VFSERVDALQVRFPVSYFGMGLQLRVRGRLHRMCFLPLSWESWTGLASKQVTISFALSDMRPARATTRRWKAALFEPGKGASGSADGISRTTSAPSIGGLWSPGPGVSAPPQYSADHLWWWDGVRWTPTLPTESGRAAKAAMPSGAEPPEPPAATPPAA